MKSWIKDNNILSAGTDGGTEVYDHRQEEWIQIDEDSPRQHKIRHFSVVEMPLKENFHQKILLFG